MTKLFKDMTLAEKFNVIAVAVAGAGLDGADEMKEFLVDRANKVTKANKSERKANADSVKLKDEAFAVLAETGRATADTVFEKLTEAGYTDGNKAGLTIARVRSALSALVKDEVAVKFDADRKKNAEFTKVSYEVAGATAEAEAEAEATEAE